MNKQIINLDNLILIGITTRTNNTNEFNPTTAKIGATVNSYFNNQIANEINARIHPGITYAVYTNYESDEHGDYTYFIGEEVKSIENQNLSKFTPLIVPASTYQKFTTNSGQIPHIVIAAWQEIWQMDHLVFGGKRKYLADFEVYDHRASNPNNAIIDIYIGIDPN